jgi:hypothetical protein
LSLIKAGKSSDTPENCAIRSRSMKSLVVRQNCSNGAKRRTSPRRNASDRPEVRAKIAATLRGRHPSEETRAKLRAVCAQRKQKQGEASLPRPE